MEQEGLKVNTGYTVIAVTFGAGAQGENEKKSTALQAAPYFPSFVPAYSKRDQTTTKFIKRRY